MLGKLNRKKEMAEMRQKIERLTELLTEAEKINAEIFDSMATAYHPAAWDDYCADPENNIDVMGIRPVVCELKRFTTFHRGHSIREQAGYSIPRMTLLNLDDEAVKAEVDARRVTSETKSPRQIERAERESATAAQADSPAEAVA